MGISDSYKPNLGSICLNFACLSSVYVSGRVVSHFSSCFAKSAVYIATRGATARIIRLANICSSSGYASLV